MQLQPTKFIYWTPRILSSIFVLFLALMSLDVFDSATTPKDIAIGLLMHNIPALILLAVLIIAWKREWVGAIVFILAGFIYIGFVLKTAITTGFEWYMLLWIIQITGVAFLIGYLFWLNWKKKERSG